MRQPFDTEAARQGIQERQSAPVLCAFAVAQYRGRVERLEQVGRRWRFTIL